MTPASRERSDLGLPGCSLVQFAPTEQAAFRLVFSCFLIVYTPFSSCSRTFLIVHLDRIHTLTPRTEWRARERHQATSRTHTAAGKDGVVHDEKTRTQDKRQHLFCRCKLHQRTRRQTRSERSLDAGVIRQQGGGPKKSSQRFPWVLGP